MTTNAAFYIDGFNLYHALDDLQKPYLKWLDLRSLAQLLIPSKTETLTKVVFCTAIRTDPPDRMLRHRAYLKALEVKGVVCLKGHFADEKKECRECGAKWTARIEKQSDVNLSLAIFDDAYCDVFDHCYLLTSDGDQAATVHLLKRRFPGKRLTTVSPPGRAHNKMIFAEADAKIAVSESHIERCVFPRFVAGKESVLRPAKYDPPNGWVHPNDRPGK